MRRAVVEHERAVGKPVERRVVVALPARGGIDALEVQMRVDRVGARRSGVQRLPGLDEAVVVRAAAQRAGTVTRRESRRLVEEEKFGESSGLEQRCSLPVLEPQLAGDPAPAVPAPPDPSLVVMEAAAVPVDEPARGCSDQFAERSDAVLAHAVQG